MQLWIMLGISLCCALISVWTVIRVMRDQKKRDAKDRIQCPECGTTKLRVLNLSEAPLQRYSTPFECENGHRFNCPSSGP